MNHDVGRVMEGQQEIKSDESPVTNCRCGSVLLQRAHLKSDSPTETFIDSSW